MFFEGEAIRPEEVRAAQEMEEEVLATVTELVEIHEDSA
jgi:glutamate/tyrosine decarboxylase-like PLP-dependent enzyme